jgi:hypothetical protein
MSSKFTVCEVTKFKYEGWHRHCAAWKTGLCECGTRRDDRISEGVLFLDEVMENIHPQGIRRLTSKFRGRRSQKGGGNRQAQLAGGPLERWVSAI